MNYDMNTLNSRDFNFETEKSDEKMRVGVYIKSYQLQQMLLDRVFLYKTDSYLLRQILNNGINLPHLR